MEDLACITGQVPHCVILPLLSGLVCLHIIGFHRNGINTNGDGDDDDGDGDDDGDDDNKPFATR